MTKSKLIYIEWEDAHGRSTWHSEEELEDYHKGERCIIKEVGWLYRETKDYITMYSRVTDWTHNEENQYGQLQKIPKTWIRKRKVLKI